MVEAIIVKDIWKVFKNKIVLQNINFSLNKQEILGITGPSGSGKSVLIKILMGFYSPDKGEVLINKKIGFSTQENSIYENLTVKQNLNYFAKINNVKKRKDKIDVLLNALGLLQYKNNLVLHLSGGTKKRVDIACSLLTDPEVLILDEPFAGLDSFLIKEISDFLKTLRTSGLTIVFSSHNLTNMEYLCDKILLVKDSRVAEISKSQLNNIY